MSATIEQIWFGTRAVRFEPGQMANAAGEQWETLTDVAQFATNTAGTADLGFSNIQYQQLVAFLGDAAAQAALGIDLANGVDPSSGTGSAGDLRVGEGVTGHNISDLTGAGSGSSRVTVLSNLDSADDPVRISGHGKLGVNALAEAASSGTTGNFVTFGNDIGFGLVNLSGAEKPGNATRLNDGDSVSLAVQQGKFLQAVAFTVKVLGGGDTEVILDTDGRTIRDTNGSGTAGGFVQDGSLGELSLGSLAHGAKVVVDFALSSITINGTAFASDASGFFQAYVGNGRDQVTFGSRVVSDLGLTSNPGGTGWSADDLVLTVTDNAAGAPTLLPAGGPVLSFDLFGEGDAAPSGLQASRLYAYLDADGSNSLDAAEVATAEDLGRLRDGLNSLDDPAGDGDDNPVQGAPGSLGLDLIDMYALGAVNRSAFADPSGLQYGEHITANWTSAPGHFALGVDTDNNLAVVTDGGPAGSPGDIDAGDHLGPNPNGLYVDLGETLGFVLNHKPAAAARITYGDALDFTPGDAADIIVRLYSGGTLLKTVTQDVAATAAPGATPGSLSTAWQGAGESGSFIVQADLGTSFDRIEIQAAGEVDLISIADAGARFVLTDLDFALIG